LSILPALFCDEFFQDRVGLKNYLPRAGFKLQSS
jgi:hypothetical protein